MSAHLHRPRLAQPLAPLDLLHRRLVPLVPHAIAKCPRCGATLVTDPLPHLCNPKDAPRRSVTGLLSEDRW